MRRLSMLVLLLVTVQTVFSQDISIESFVQLETDLTANTAGTEVLDQNGEKCALIKVSTTLTDFTFDAGMMGVTKVIQKDGEIWVYVPAGVKRLSISHAGMESLRDCDLGMTLNRACTYLLKLKTAKDVIVQEVTFKITPANASVMIESSDQNSDFGKQSLTLTDGTASFRIPVGDYKYTAIASGYMVEEGTFNLSATSPRKVVLEMTAAKALETVASKEESKPDGKGEVNKKTFEVNGVKFDMVYVEGGTYTMGASEQESKAESIEKPAHEVKVSSFYMGQAEVTQQLWTAVMGKNPSANKGDLNPVDKVSWTECEEFISKLRVLTGEQFRMPTEAEWEYAARGGNKSQGYKFSGGNDLDGIAWNQGNSSIRSHSVMSRNPNELGLYDMTGNVSEWCSDVLKSYDGSDKKNTGSTAKKTGGLLGGIAIVSLSSTGYVVRGGSYFDEADNCRVTCRKSSLGDKKSMFVGLRLAL